MSSDHARTLKPGLTASMRIVILYSSPCVDRLVSGVMGLARFSEAHVALFLHNGERPFGRAQPALLEKILTAARSHAAAAGVCPEALNVRCIELHTYHGGGGLLEAGHYDKGSTLTVSMLLSPPGPPEHGGRFSTTSAAGEQTEHELEAGDAIVFCSEMVHNVSTLGADAQRNSLVIELWTDNGNSVGRYS